MSVNMSDLTAKSLSHRSVPHPILCKNLYSAIGTGDNKNPAGWRGRRRHISV